MSRSDVSSEFSWPDRERIKRVGFVHLQERSHRLFFELAFQGRWIEGVVSPEGVAISSQRALVNPTPDQEAFVKQIILEYGRNIPADIESALRS